MRCVLYDVYECLPVSRWTKFFTLDEKNWSEYLQHQDAFSPETYEELQRSMRATLDILLKEERKAAMKRFLTILLFTIVCTVLFFALDSLCNGAEPMHITISEPSSPQSTPYPSVVYKMTDAEFFLWATDQNDKARAEWEEWYKTAPPRWTSCSVTDYKRQYRDSWRGRGITGYNQAGYEHRYTTSGLAHGFKSGLTRRYTKRFLNPDYYSRPLTIINPYCRPTQPRQLYSF